MCSCPLPPAWPSEPSLSLNWVRRLRPGPDTGEVVSTFQTGREIYGLAVSPDGKLLAVADFGPEVRLYQADSGDEHARLSGHNRPVVRVAFAPDGRTLVSGGFDGVVRLWRVDLHPAMSPAPPVVFPFRHARRPL